MTALSEKVSGLVREFFLSDGCVYLCPCSIMIHWVQPTVMIAWNIFLSTLGIFC